MGLPISRRLGFSEIPVIDLDEYRSGSDTQLTVAALKQACSEVGFFYVRNHGIAPDLIYGERFGNDYVSLE